MFGKNLLIIRLILQQSNMALVNEEKQLTGLATVLFYQI
jgi:hypothetical protein